MVVEVARGVEVGPWRADRAGRVAQEVQARLLAGADDVVVVAQVPRGVEQRGRADQLQLALLLCGGRALPTGEQAALAAACGAVDAQPFGQRRRQHVRRLLGLVRARRASWPAGSRTAPARCGPWSARRGAAPPRPAVGAARCRRRARARPYRRATMTGRRATARTVRRGGGMTRQAPALGRVLVTGGAGFIGCALSRLLAGQRRALGRGRQPAPAGARHRASVRPRLHEAAELVVADVVEPGTWDGVLPDLRPDVVVHLAAETGTAQSLSESTRHGSVNVVGTTQLLDGLTRAGHVPGHFVLTSSRAVYGEGTWRRTDGTLFQPGAAHARPARGGSVGLPRRRARAQLRARQPRRRRRACTAPPSSPRSTCSARGPARTTSRCRCCGSRTSTARASR